MAAVEVNHEYLIGSFREASSDLQRRASKCDNLKEKGKFLHLAATCKKEIERIERHRQKRFRQFVRFMLAGFADHTASR